MFISGFIGEITQINVKTVKSAILCCLAIGPIKYCLTPTAPPKSLVYAVNIAKSAAKSDNINEISVPPAIPAPIIIKLSDNLSGNSLYISPTADFLPHSIATIPSSKLQSKRNCMNNIAKIGITKLYFTGIKICTI